MCGKLLRSLGSCAELLLLHFSSFVIGRRLEVTVGSEEENLLQPSVPYSPSDARPVSTTPGHVITVSAPKDAPRYQNMQLHCSLRKSNDLKMHCLSIYCCSLTFSQIMKS